MNTSNFTEKELKELKAEEETERAQELQKELDEVPMYEWIEDNKETLKDEYIEQQEDGFNEYCKNAYNEDCE